MFFFGVILIIRECHFGSFFCCYLSALRRPYSILVLWRFYDVWTYQLFSCCLARFSLLNALKKFIIGGRADAVFLLPSRKSQQPESQVPLFCLSMSFYIDWRTIYWMPVSDTSQFHFIPNQILNFTTQQHRFLKISIVIIWILEGASWFLVYQFLLIKLTLSFFVNPNNRFIIFLSRWSLN